MSAELESVATAPWIFKTLPGTKPASQWPDSLEALSERLQHQDPAALWYEPFDWEDKFHAQAKEFIRNSIAKKRGLYHVSFP